MKSLSFLQAEVEVVKYKKRLNDTTYWKYFNTANLHSGLTADWKRGTKTENFQATVQFWVFNFLLKMNYHLLMTISRI